MAKFEDQLFDDLMRTHGAALDAVPDRPTTARRGVGRTLGIGGAVLGAAGVIALTGTVLTGGAPAYAVTKGADGVVEVSISDITGVTGANEELRRLGVRAVAVPMRDGCVDLASLPVDTASRGTGITSSTESVDGAQTGSMKFDADEIPEGDTLLLAATQSADSLTLGAALIRGAAPECVSAPQPHEGDLPNGEQGREVRPDAPTGSAVEQSGR
ncbi:hypothetical protein ACIQMJ_27080 [Actinosynnema sp. NPDC091369]